MAVMKEIREIKKRSSALFGKCWAEAAFISLLQMGLFLLLYAVVMLLGLVTGAVRSGYILPHFMAFPPGFVIGSLILILVYYTGTAPLMIGIRWYYWQAAEENIMPVSSVFAGYRSTEYALKLVRLKVISDFRRLVPTGLFAVGAAASVLLGGKLLEYPMTDEEAVLLKAVSILVCAMFILLFFLSQMQYVPVSYLLADNPDAGTDDIIKFSRKIVSKRYAAMTIMYLSFTGWYILCIAGFPVLVLIPYLYMTTAVFINRSIERINSEITPEGIENELKNKENIPIG